MTKGQHALVRYWLTGASIALVLILIYFVSGSIERFRWFLLPAIVFAAYVERGLRPERPENAPTPLKLIQTSRAWSLFFIVFALSAVGLAIVAVTFNGFGSWLSHRPWLMGALIIALILFPAIQSEIYMYRALGYQPP